MSLMDSSPTSGLASATKLREILLGKAKPLNDGQAIQAASALMWRQAFQIAMKPLQEEEDPLSAPQKQSIRDTQAQWMGVEAAITFSQSLSGQLGHAGIHGQASGVFPRRLGDSSSVEETKNMSPEVKNLHRT
jgi:hypothetical protein